MATLALFVDTVGRALMLDRTVFAEVQVTAWGPPLTVMVVLLAGLSEAAGQSLVLFLNRVTPRRMVLSLLLSAVLYVFGFLVLGLSIWLIGHYLFERAVAPTAVLRAISLGYAPYLFSFFILTPYLGMLIDRLLALWSLLAILIAVQVTLSLTLVQAAACSGLGWLLVQVARRTVGLPLIILGRHLRNRIAGVPLVTDNRQLRRLLGLEDER